MNDEDRWVGRAETAAALGCARAHLDSLHRLCSPSIRWRYYAGSGKRAKKMYSLTDTMAFFARVLPPLSHEQNAALNEAAHTILAGRADKVFRT